MIASTTLIEPVEITPATAELVWFRQAQPAEA